MKVASVKPTLCISISERPGKFGLTVYTAAFKATGINFIYKPLAVRDVGKIIPMIKQLGIRGCSVSMPFKEKIIPYLDQLDPLAKKIGAVNTVVNDNGKLTGYNTDIVGAQEILKRCDIFSNDHILLLGAGGVARAILTACNIFNLKNITISNRNFPKGQLLAKIFNVNYKNWEERETISAKMLINTTPIGMMPKINNTPISQNAIKNFKIIFDVVSSPPTTKLVKIARLFGINTIDGLTMALEQAYAQFRLYTKIDPPKEVMLEATQKLLSD